MPNKPAAAHSRALLPLAMLTTMLLAACGVAAAQPSSQAASRESLQQLQSRIENLKQELDRTEGAHTEASDALKQSEQAISETNRKLRELVQQQKTSAAALNAIRKDRSGLETMIALQQKLLSDQLYRQHLNGQQGYLRALLEQRDPNAIARDVYYLGYVSRARARLIENLRQNLTHVAQLNAQTESALQEVAQFKNAQEKERQELQKQQTERKTVLKKLAAQIKSQRGEISRLQRDEKRLSQLVERLARIVPKAPPRKSAVPKEKNQRNEALPTPVPGGGAFASLKGKLRLPARGELANRFGAAREDSGVSWKGLFIRAAEGDEVRSVANGRVVFADWLRGFGNLLIVDHGDGYMSLYSNNQSLLKKVGDEVSAGDTIAVVGNSGGNPEAGLYFEIRYQSKPFDPLSWCSIR
ncbi:MAG TPA: peptidoglycan DD-metalloendopeptidase family protein [Novimethylophilus sp.]|uniref:murein hydrolase activator EnvC family protein n=1 Tax=Novimethylophilus sp. TaxID=2137426 RepID=UPI002F3E2BE7